MPNVTTPAGLRPEMKGYSSVNQSNLEQVKEYITCQEEHHRKMSFQDELRALRRKYEVEWDERCVWD